MVHRDSTGTSIPVRGKKTPSLLASCNSLSMDENSASLWFTDVGADVPLDRELLNRASLGQKSRLETVLGALDAVGLYHAVARIVYQYHVEPFRVQDYQLSALPCSLPAADSPEIIEVQLRTSTAAQQCLVCSDAVVDVHANFPSKRRSKSTFLCEPHHDAAMANSVCSSCCRPRASGGSECIVWKG